MIIVSIFQNADSYRSHPNLESEIATRTISTELNAHADQYELTETITVPPEAAHTEIVESLPSSSSKAGKFLSNFGIKMLEEEDAGTNLPCFLKLIYGNNKTWRSRSNVKYLNVKKIYPAISFNIIKIGRIDVS